MKICEFRPTQWIETENPIDYIIENIYCNRTMWHMKLDILRQKDELLDSRRPIDMQKTENCIRYKLCTCLDT